MGELKAGQVIKIGRDKKSDFQIALAGISNLHIEIKAVDGGSEDPTLMIIDKSMNGTSVERPSATERLTKDVEAPLPDGTMIVFPMKIRKGDPLERVRMAIRFGEEKQPTTEGKKGKDNAKDKVKEKDKDADSKKAKKADKKDDEKVVEKSPGKNVATPEPKATGKDKVEEKAKNKKKSKDNLKKGATVFDAPPAKVDSDSGDSSEDSGAKAGAKEETGPKIAEAAPSPEPAKKADKSASDSDSVEVAPVVETPLMKKKKEEKKKEDELAAAQAKAAEEKATKKDKKDKKKNRS